VANFRYRLLVIDDEPLNQELLAISLSAAGYEVAVAKDGFAALAQMHGALPDLIISDLKMPNMSGFEFLSIARRRFPQIPTIAVSGEFHPPIEPLGVIADAFLSKPFSLDELQAKIAGCQGRGERSPHHAISRRYLRVDRRERSRDQANRRDAASPEPAKLRSTPPPSFLGSATR